MQRTTLHVCVHDSLPACRPPVRLCRRCCCARARLVCVQRRIVAQNIKRLKDIGCYRGRRHIMVGSSRGCCSSASGWHGMCCLHHASKASVAACISWARAGSVPRVTGAHSVACLRLPVAQGLPTRGQRTKTNARTRKGKPKTVAGKKK